MKTPFTVQEFFEIFEEYNSSVFPIQLIIFLLGILGIVMIYRNKKAGGMVAGLILAGIWLWTGLVYHIIFFTAINKAAYAFGGLFIIQGLFFIIESLRGKLEFSSDKNARYYIGYFFIIFGLIIYPVISYLIEGSLSRTISLGLPCPSTIMTFGFLMIMSRKLSKYLLIIPSLWALTGTMAATSFGVYQDYVMLLAAVVANIYLLRKRD